MMRSFLITIDTEGDNLWSRPRVISTENARYLHRFQSLCERFSFKPTWLTNYEMAIDPIFLEFGLDVIRRGAGEIGMHLHAWNSPPIHPLTKDDNLYHPYLIEFDDTMLRLKIQQITELLEDRFSIKMRSHRAGRWALNSHYAQALVDFGYVVDCSVTPGVSWVAHKGSPEMSGGSDYVSFPNFPYFMDLTDISKPGNSTLLEVPMTCRKSRFGEYLGFSYRVPFLRKIVSRVSREVEWLRPTGENLDSMISIVRRALASGDKHLEFMLHSSELMPGGSPTFATQRQIDALYDQLEALFSKISASFVGQTLNEFAADFVRNSMDSPMIVQHG